MGVLDAMDPETEQELPTQQVREIPRIEDEVQEGVTTDTAGRQYPKRYWTAGPGTPQVKLVRTRRGTNGKLSAKALDRLEPRYYAYVVENHEDEMFLLNSSMKNRVWPEDLEPDDPAEVCSECGYTCRSVRAMNAHLRTHRRGQPFLATPRAVGPQGIG